MTIDSGNGVEFVYAPADADGGEGLLAIVVRGRTTREPGAQFLTDREATLQLGVIRYEAGDAVAPHVHKEWSRTVWSTREVLMVRRGSVKVGLYLSSGRLVQEVVLVGGDVVYLAGGGHGLKVLEPGTEIIEVKQGPYAGSRLADKRNLETR